MNIDKNTRMPKISVADANRAHRQVVPRVVRRPLDRFRQYWHPVYLLQSRWARIADRNLRRLSERLGTLKGAYRGRRCFIIGNGPSLNQMDLELLQHEHVWGANKIYLLFDRLSWRPGFYVAVDRRVVPDIKSDIAGLVSKLRETKFFFPSLFRVHSVIESAANVYWYREIKPNRSNIPHSMFTADASKWVSGVNTVTIAAMQLAAFLGFDPIYLIGCDTSYTVPSTVRFEKNDHRKLVSTQDDDPNHFDPRYFGKGSRWHDPSVGRMIFHYEQAKRVCDSIGVEVYNATVGGKLEVFPRVDYEQLF